MTATALATASPIPLSAELVIATPYNARWDVYAMSGRRVGGITSWAPKKDAPAAFYTATVLMAEPNPLGQYEAINVARDVRAYVRYPTFDAALAGVAGVLAGRSF